jgi:hypothetical protein
VAARGESVGTRAEEGGSAAVKRIAVDWIGDCLEGGWGGGDARVGFDPSFYKICSCNG